MTIVEAMMGGSTSDRSKAAAKGWETRKQNGGRIAGSIRSGANRRKKSSFMTFLKKRKSGGGY